MQYTQANTKKSDMAKKMGYKQISSSPSFGGNGKYDMKGGGAVARAGGMKYDQVGGGASQKGGMKYSNANKDGKITNSGYTQGAKC